MSQLQVRNSQMSDLLSSEFIRRNDIALALNTLDGTYKMLPRLRGFWPLSSVNESLNAIDSSGQGRTLTNNGSISTSQFTATRVPYSQFNGSTQHWSRADEAGLDITSNITFGAWVYHTAANSCTIISKWNQTTNNKSYALNLNSLGSYAFYISNNGSSTSHNVISTATVEQNKWKLIIGRYTNSTAMDIFVNGHKTTEGTTVPASIYSGSATFNIGGRNDGQEYMTGYIALPFLCAWPVADAHLDMLFQWTRVLFGV